MKYKVVDGNMVCTGTWPKTKKAALKSSIEKWETIVLYLQGTKAYEWIGVACEECSLCRLYNEYGDSDTVVPDCTKCPVMKKTGLTGCTGTPYDLFCDADTHEKSLRAARREVRFLESLL